tara:strand:+ start:1359 stop:1655 length:297 start_codon:yes stop_codon:yes gene_type:complete
MRHTIHSKERKKGKKNRNKSRMLDAVAIYLQENGASTVYSISDNARFKNGNLVRNNNSFKGIVSLALILSRDPRFIKAKKLTRENIWLWDYVCEGISE